MFTNIQSAGEASAETQHANLWAASGTCEYQGRTVKWLAAVTTCSAGVAPTGAEVSVDGETHHFEPSSPCFDECPIALLLEDWRYARLYAQHPRGQASSFHPSIYDELPA